MFQSGSVISEEEDAHVFIEPPPLLLCALTTMNKVMIN